ncbi:hypothetical protein ACFE04_027999 [Oxalis oulophora]
MENESKKRKMGDDDEDEEEKMEKFFALIKSTKEARDRLMGKSKQKEDDDDKEKPIAPWNPSFQPEDFMEKKPSSDVNKTHDHQAQAGPSNTQQDDNNKKEDSTQPSTGNGLDLNLCL